MKENKTKKKIRQLDYYTNEEIEVYESMVQAAEDNYMSKESLQKALVKRGGCFHKSKLKFEYA